MARPRVYVTTNEIPESARAILESVAEVAVNPKPGPLDRTVLLDQVTEADGIFCLLTDRIDADVLGRAKRLKVVGNMAVGYDNVDVREATKRSVHVTNTPGVLTETTADMAMALLLAAARRVVEGDRYLREGRWSVQWSPMMMVGTDVHDKVLGIYGLGRIGVAMARRAKGFGMKVVYYSKTRKPQLEGDYGLEYSSFEKMLGASDFVSVHVPLSEETRHSIGARELGLMKRSAFLINTARGPIVDEAALALALKERKIAGAALDVFEREPLSRESPLLRLDNVVLLPHMGSASVETRTAMAEMAARNIAASLRGEVPPNLVNGESNSLSHAV